MNKITREEAEFWGWTEHQTHPRWVPRMGLAMELSEWLYKSFNCELGEIDLLVTIMIEAAKDRDHDYFNSYKFEQHCEALDIDRDNTYKLFYHHMERFDNAN